MSREFQRNAGNPFGGSQAPTVTEVDAALYGTVDVPTSGRVVSRPIEIMQIRADVKQPRRAVPAVVRLHWDGRAAMVPALLDQWQELAEKRGRFRLDVVAIINGKEGLEDVDQAPAVTQEFVALCRLAQSIHKDGLINPVSVIERSQDHLIETGERRWLAYHLLHLYLGERYRAIPARISDGRDYIWRQAQENTARRALNAISMARQLALLIMDARRDVDGVKYDDYENLILNGECDRRYYAQIANGNVHRIPRGMGERIEAAMGLSKHRIAQYRNLLRLTEDDAINDALWTKADVEDWSEKAIREIAQMVPIDVLKTVVADEDWTLEHLREEAHRLTQVNLSQQKAVGIPANPYSVPAVPRSSQVPEKAPAMYTMVDIARETSTDKAVSSPSPSPLRGDGMMPSPPAPLPMSEGNYNAAIPQSVGGRPLLDEGDERWRLLAALEGLAAMLGDNDLAHDLRAVRNLTSARVREQRRTILDYLQSIYDGVSVKFAQAGAGLDQYFAEIEQMLSELSEDE